MLHGMLNTLGSQLHLVILICVCAALNVRIKYKELSVYNKVLTQFEVLPVLVNIAAWLRLFFALATLHAVFCVVKMQIKRIWKRYHPR